MGCKIACIEYYLPDQIIDNDELSKLFVGWDSKKIEKKTGIRQRHVVADNETSLDLAFKAGKKLLEQYERKDIDFLIVCTETPDYYLPPNSCILQKKLGLKNSIGTFDINMGCSGFVYGLAIAKGLINTDAAKRVLFVTSETYSKLMYPKDKANRTIFGDAAAATIIEKDEKEYIQEFVFGTDGSGADDLIVPNGGIKNRYDPLATEVESVEGSFITRNNLYMNGPEIFNFMISAVPKLFNDVLEKNSTTLDKIEFVVFHQANKYMLDYVRAKINIPKFKFYNNLLKTGNTVSSSIPIALKDCMDNNLIIPGNRILLAGFGVGLSWAGTIIQL